jgi:glycosyltransferase involved in cell wall biosynthesis
MSSSGPTRVLHAVSCMDRGGIETFLMRLYRAIDRSRVQFDFLVHKPGEGAYDEEILSLGGRIFPIRFSFHPLALPRYVADLRTFLASHPEYRVVHAHLNAFNGILLAAAAASMVSKRIAHSHTQSAGSLLREPLWSVVKRLGIHAATERFACSVDAGRWAYGDSRPFTLVENGIPLEAFAFDESARANIRQEHGLEGKFVVGHVGAFRQEKNQSFLLDVLLRLLPNEPTARLLLVGQGSERAAVVARARELGLSDYVMFVGETAAPESFYSAMDFFAFPSLKEGLGIAAIEAQAAGLPCLVSTGVPPAVIATPAAVRRSLDASAWATEILQRMTQPQTRLVDRRALLRYDIARTAEDLQRVYLVSSPASVRSDTA